MKVKGTLLIQIYHNTITSCPFGQIMKSVDDTPPPKSESEQRTEAFLSLCQVVELQRKQIKALSRRVACLEERKVANENNQDDPEWY